MVCLLGFWQVLTNAGFIQSHRLRWQLMAMAQMTQQAEQAMQNAKASALALTHAQTNDQLLEYQLQLDELILAWPNSALRTQLIHRLQQLAQAKNLQIVHMKFIPLTDEQGFEVGALDVSLKGTQWATSAYLQSLNQLFQNGIWSQLTWRWMPTGDYSLDGQIHLLWNAEDAFTDTGVELQAASRVKAEKKALSLDARVLPDHSVGQMRLVGAAQSLTASGWTLFWTLLQSGRQVSAVQAGQYLGIENRLVHSLDDKGLWLRDEWGNSATVLPWEKVSP
jgi:DICT domain-containing protein